MKRDHSTCWIDTVKTARFLALLVVFAGMARNACAEDSEIYLEEIKPLLEARCYACHGALKQESDLRLDTAQAIVKAGILQDGRLLMRVASADLDVRMPPEGEP